MEKQSRVELFSAKLWNNPNIMKGIWTFLIFIWSGVSSEYTLPSCVSSKQYIDITTLPDYDYNYHERNERRDYHSSIICTDVNRISPSLFQCDDLKCKSITFEKSNISIVPTNAFMEAGSLTVINMTSSGICDIEIGAFFGLLQVEEIYLDMNNIYKISRGSFNSLIKLKILHLSKNSIQEIETASFHGSSSITDLDLSFNKLTSIPKDLLEPLKQLKSLNISSNYLTSLNNNLCFNLMQLRHVLLADNKVTEFDNCIEKLFIKKLSLSNNLLIDLSNITFPHTIEDLRLDNNNITELSEDTFTKLVNLRVIDLAKNPMKNQSLNLFKNLKHLEVLNISNNEIEFFDPDGFSTLKKLNVLNINGNKISNLQKGMFKVISGLEEFDISFNNISYIPLDVLSDFQNLKTLNLSGNSIEYLESGVFNELNNLKTLDISRNSLTSLKSHILFPLKGLEILNVAYNELKSLKITDLIVHCPNIKSLNIDGNKFSCQELSNIFVSSKWKKLLLEKGKTTVSENVNGIACFENETSWSKKNFAEATDYTNFSEDIKTSELYEFLRNFSLFKRIDDNKFNNNLTILDNNELKLLRNVSHSFIFELSSIVKNMKEMKYHEHFDGNFSMLISDIKDFLKNETMHLDDIVNILSKIAKELKAEHENVTFNISKLMKIKNNMSDFNTTQEEQKYFDMKNCSLAQLLDKFISSNVKLEKQLRRNTDKFSNFTSLLEKEMKLLMKFENSSFGNQLSKTIEKLKDGRTHEAEPSEAMFLKNDGGKTSITPEINSLINALNQLKLFIIFSMLLLMAIFSVKIFRYLKSDFYNHKNKENSSLELPFMDK